MGSPRGLWKKKVPCPTKGATPRGRAIYITRHRGVVPFASLLHLDSYGER